jgi:hypothetical protein
MFRAFENRILKGMCGFKIDEITGGQTKVHNSRL